MTATAWPTKTSAKWYALHQAANLAGIKAANACTPTPMIVGQPTHPLGNDIDPAKPVYFVPSGVCGFAWINVPGNSGFGRWIKAEGIGRKAYGGGIAIRAHVGGQSLEIKEAYAHAYAEVLHEAGVTAYVESRMD
jgi:hypothetical protein